MSKFNEYFSFTQQHPLSWRWHPHGKVRLYLLLSAHLKNDTKKYKKLIITALRCESAKAQGLRIHTSRRIVLRCIYTVMYNVVTGKLHYCRVRGNPLKIFDIKTLSDIVTRSKYFLSCMANYGKSFDLTVSHFCEPPCILTKIDGTANELFWLPPIAGSND